ncbi:MAG: alpha-galactosidase, partial [Treponemataceae bacterium]|nr:alpha-galactosidase [Treponemataceae bacterium]
LDFLGKVPGGWESWYNHYAEINENIILEDLKSLKETKNIISMMYIDQKKPCVFQIDDGWEFTVGNWEIRPDRFPNGLKSISDKIEENGMIPGLWIAPFLCDLRAPIYKEHPEWVLTDATGIPVSAGFNPIWGAEKGEYQPRKSGTFYCLDLSNDQVLDYLDKLIDRAINEWGIRYLKLDFLYAGMLYGKFKNGGSAYQWYYRAVKTLTKRKTNAQGKPVAYLGCGMPFEHSFNDFPLSRIGCDTYENWDNNLMKFIRWNGRTSAYLSLKDTIGRSIWNKSVHYNDPDVMFVRNNNCTLTKDEKMIIATIDLLFGNQVMYSDDPAISSGEEEAALAKEIADLAKKFENEEFSIIPSSVDIFNIKSRSGKYSAVLDMKKRKLTWNEAK